MDSDTVTWDQAEPEDLLFWVQRALHRYIENPDCEECLGLAREGLGRLRPGLEVAGQHDSIPLCEELLRVATALDEGRLQWSPDASALIEQASRRLSALAEPDASEAQGGLLLPLVNELRALRGVGALMMPAIVMASGAATATATRAPSAAKAPDGRLSRAPEPTKPDPPPRRSTEPKAAPAVDAPARSKPVPPPPPVAPEAGRATVSKREAAPEPRPAPSVQGAESGPPGASDTARLAYDRELLERAVLAPHLDRAPARLPEVLATAVRGLDKAFARWRQEGAAADGARALADRLRLLRTMARPVALRFGEFAGVFEFLLNALADRERPVGREAVQLIEDAIEVLPLLLDEVRAGGPADTPLADILLRAESTLAQEPSDTVDETPAPPDTDMPGLEQIRSRGQAEMSRLAAVFESLDGGAGSAERQRAAPAGAAAGGGLSDLGAAREQVAQLADWQHRVVDALTRIAAQAQALETLIALLHSSRREKESADTEATGFGTPEALDDLRQLHKGLGVAVGDASAAVLRQQRLTRVLQDSLSAADLDSTPASGRTRGPKRD